jgi:hypothetical protein
MAAARNLPPIADDNPNPQVITITNGIPSPATCIIANGQQVQFINTSTSPINIYFQTDTQGKSVFTSPILIGSQGNYTATPNPNYPDRTVNFSVNDTQNFPYAIQVGAGPLYIYVSMSNLAVIEVMPSPATIPSGGTWELFQASTDTHTYNVTWPNIAAPPFPNFTVNNTPQMASAVTGSFDYKVKLPGGIAAKTGSGGGTIKVGGN